ncbi:GNAT family N-acetyltransferase [Micromonospora sp. CPCC 206061]|uniref:GNAT family N-acetyltransferase n=1 Tax=Micromonospora sp. CPCC 206061 TaxID=3122410 RepID=UPI002FF1B159
MRRVTLEGGSIAAWLAEEAPGPGAILGHVVATGHGRAWADRWPSPSALLVEVGGNYLLAGTPAAVDPAALRPLVTGFLAASKMFAPVVAEAFPDRMVWDRLIYRLPAGHSGPPSGPLPGVRALSAADAEAVAGLSEEVAWVVKTWGGPAGLASYAHAHGAFVDGRLVAVVGTFFLGVRHEDAVVATEPQWRGRGLATACARAWCAGVVARGRTPTWTTSPDNHGSWRIAERLGLELVRRDVLHVIGVDVFR